MSYRRGQKISRTKFVFRVEITSLYRYIYRGSSVKPKSKKFENSNITRDTRFLRFTTDAGLKRTTVEFGKSVQNSQNSQMLLVCRFVSTVESMSWRSFWWTTMLRLSRVKYEIHVVKSDLSTVAMVNGVLESWKEQDKVNKLFEGLHKGYWVTV